jgi:hypothetical protein
MKSSKYIKSLFGLLLIMSLPALAAEGSAVGPLNFQVSVGEDNSCALDADGVKCWGDNTEHQLEVPVLKSPIQVDVGYRNACALDAEGVKCWGFRRSYAETLIPFLKSPTSVNVGTQAACAIDLEGVKCWRNLSNDRIKVPRLKSPTQVVVGGANACAMTANGIKCWDHEGKMQPVPKLKAPTQLVVGEDYACVLDVDAVKCWGNNENGETEVPNLKSPYYLSTNSGYTCALDAEGVKCWGFKRRSKFYDENKVKLIHPTQIAATVSHICALDIEGMKCWGDDEHDAGEKTVPPLNLDLLKPAILSLSGARAEYIKTLVAVSPAKQPLRYVFASPSVLSVDSEYFIENFIPRFQKLAKYNEERLGYSTNPASFRNVPDTAEDRKLAILAIKSTLEIGANFLAPDQQKSLQGIIRSAGVAIADSMNNQKVLNLVKQVDALSSEKQKLKSSPKSAFLVDTLELAANWLREKVK